MSEILVFKSIAEFQKYRTSLKGSVGVVPTMGALHPGHASLIQQSARQNQTTIVTIFVNPTQFNNPEDLKKYPRTLEADVELAQKAGAQIVLAPEFNEIYPDEYRYKLTENDFSKKLCGAHRPGHFDGVLTVVMKLLQLTQADQSYFGEKDYQQLKLIQNMAQAFFLKTKINACATLRETDGLAMSSRNVRLTPAGREKAPAIYKALTQSRNVEEAKTQLQKSGIEVEYLEDYFNRRFVAAFIDGVRLIDNVAL